MSPERLKKIEEIYHAVLEVSPTERNSLLQDSCGNDADLRHEVESLLSFEKTIDSLIDSSPKSLIAEVFSQNTLTQINQYKIEKKIGEGGMGEVFLALDTKLERKVAIKFLSKEFATDSNRRNRFFQEAKSASALNHPNILTVHEIGEFDGTHFIVTEFINGRTLKNYLTEEKLTLQTVLEIAIQIASALAAAHEAGIIHRDIKPDNIMVRSDKIVKILDFGIAKLSDSSLFAEIDTEANTRAKTMTTPGMIIGTPQYMSPEQARGQKIDFRSDIFSFGVVLYEMINGELPFLGITKMDIIGSILKDEPKPFAEQESKISHNLEKLINKTLNKNREERYQHIKEVFTELSELKKSIEFDTELVHQTANIKVNKTVHTTSSIANERRFSLAQAIIFLGVLGTVFGLIWWFYQPLKAGQIETMLRPTEVFSWASKPGEIYSVGTFSPDGKMIAFTSTKTGTKNIWIKQATSGEAIQITKDEFRNENPIWSPNGEELAFYSTKGDKPGFWRIPVLGGSPKLIALIEDGSGFLRYWSKQNQIYFESKNELFAIDVNSGQTKKITDFVAKSINANAISISSDEQNIGYTTVDGEQSIIWTQKINTETPKKLFTSSAEIRNLAWHSDNQRIFFSASVEGTFQIFVTDVNGTVPRQISTAEKDSLVLDISTDGTKILFGSAKEESDLWGVNIKTSKEFTVASDIDSELWANVSVDGKTVVYQAVKSLSQGDHLFDGKILAKTIDSESQPIEISNLGGLPIWSPDGNTVAYMRSAENKYLLETVKVNGGQKNNLTEGLTPITNTLLPYNRLQTSYFSWSPDSKQIAYLSEKSGVLNIWIVNADGSNNYQLTDNKDLKLYLDCPLWSSDGKKIAYTSKTGNTSAQGKTIQNVWIIDVETKKSESLTQSNSFLRLLGWINNNNDLLLVSTEGSGSVGLQSEVTIMKLEIKSGKTQQITTLKDTYLFNIHLSSDTKNIAFVAHREEKDNIWLTSINGGEAKKLTANNDSRLYFSSLAWSPNNDSIFYGKQSRYSLLSMLTNFK